MKAIKAICKAIDKMNDVLGQIFSVLVLGILAVILIEVVMRRLFNSPQIWTQDLIVMLFASYIILICAYGFQKKAFVAVDVIFAIFPPLAQHILHLVTYFLFLVPFVGGMLPVSWAFFRKAFTSHELIYSVWEAPTWPVKFCFFAGLLILAIQSVSEMLKEVQGIVECARGGKLSADGKEAQK